MTEIVIARTCVKPNDISFTAASFFDAHLWRTSTPRCCYHSSCSITVDESAGQSIQTHKLAPLLGGQNLQASQRCDTTLSFQPKYGHTSWIAIFVSSADHSACCDTAGVSPHHTSSSSSVPCIAVVVATLAALPSVVPNPPAKSAFASFATCADIVHNILHVLRYVFMHTAVNGAVRSYALWDVR
jgi:hypothetical protein